MPFRPSVLPDRDNDILSTFTRSFEKARQMVRQDQADRRAQREHDMAMREREENRKDRILEGNLEIARDPSLQFQDISPEQAELARSLGSSGNVGEQGQVVGPQIGRFGRAALPEEVVPRGTGADVQVVGERGGRTVTFSQMMGDRIRSQAEQAEREREEQAEVDAREGRVDRRTGALRGLGVDRPRARASALEEDVPTDVVFPDEDDQDGQIRVGGRDFPNTEQGSQAALEWERQLTAAGASPTTGGDRSREVTRRTLAMAAVNRLADISSDWADMSEFQRRQISDGDPEAYLQGQEQEALSILGFDSKEELSQETRELRIGVDPETGRAIEPGDGDDGGDDQASQDELLLQLMEQGMSAQEAGAEAARILREREAGGG